MKKLALTLACAMCLGTMATACGSTPSSTASSAASGTTETASGDPVVITIWYEGNDSRLPFFEAVEAEMQKDYPNYSIEAVTFDNATLTTKALQAATTTGGVDLIFNSASRILSLYQQSGQAFEDLTGVLEASPNKDVVTEGDLKLCSAGDTLVVYPVSRSLAGLGVKTDVEGVEVTDDTMPADWEKFLALGEQYKAAGKSGFTMHLGTDPGQVFNLFMSGSGYSDIWLNAVPESQIENHADLYKDIISVYAGDSAFWDKDATTEDYAAMYTKIQSGSVGMFRVGDWNVANWDKADSGVGEYVVTTWPAMREGDAGGLVNTDGRGLAIPKNAPNKEAAKVFLQYVLSESAQLASFETMGSCIDTSVVPEDQLSTNQKIFFDPDVTIYSVDTYVSQLSYGPALNEVYEKGLINALNAQSADEIDAAVTKLHEDVTSAIASNQ